MDDISTVLVTSTVSVRTNTTEIIVIEREEVETLSIIVWCMGGILLISLLSLIGRIILARKNYPTHLEYIEQNGYNNNSVFRIQIGRQGCRTANGVGSLSRDTVDLVPGSDLAVTDSPMFQRTHSRTQVPCVNPTNSSSQVGNGTSVINSQTSTQRQFVTPVLTSTLPQIITSDSHGRQATVNGYVIQPPPYRDVVSTSTRLPSVIVTRPPPRGFSL